MSRPTAWRTRGAAKGAGRAGCTAGGSGAVSADQSLGRIRSPM
jgi:hypothetical protein